MLPRLQAEEVSSIISALLATNGRGMSEKQRRDYIRNLNSDPAEHDAAPKVTLGFLNRIQRAASAGAGRARKGR